MRRLGFSAQGLFEGSYYRRMPAAADPRALWTFDGIEGDIIGDFGPSGGAAAGFELDRAVIVYFETVAGGAVFPTGSITFCGSLSHNNYDNKISHLLENLLRRFAQ